MELQKLPEPGAFFFDLTDPFEFVVPCCQSSNWPIGALGEPVLPYKHWDDLSDHKQMMGSTGITQDSVCTESGGILII